MGSYFTGLIRCISAVWSGKSSLFLMTRRPSTAAESVFWAKEKASLLGCSRGIVKNEPSFDMETIGNSTQNIRHRLKGQFIKQATDAFP